MAASAIRPNGQKTAGSIRDDRYEVRGTDHPMIYVYRRNGRGFVEKATQLGDLDARQLAGMLLHELPH